MSTTARASETDHASVRGRPPLFFLVSLGIALAIHYGLWPLRFTIPGNEIVTSRYIHIALGVGVATLGFATMLSAVVQHLRVGNDPSPHSSTRSLITTGSHRFTRNPIYLGVGLIQAGIAIGTGSIWALASVLVAMTLAHFMAVLPEEAYLEDKFGDDYRQYKRSVRRWI